MFRSCRQVLSSVALGLLALAVAPAAARAEDKVSFITDWTAEAEHGGFYQAVATGIYKKYGLDVTLRQGGPSMNTGQMLAAGAVDMRMGASSGNALNYVKEGVPAVVVAAIFQKEPSILMAHPGVGNDSLAALKGKPIAISNATVNTWWKFLAAKFGYADSQIRPYTFNNAPFLVDKNLVQQGYLTSEPYAIEKEGGFKPVIFLLSNVKENIPVVAVAAFYQKSSRVLITHPGQGNDTLEQLKGKPILLSASARNGFWLWLKAKYGYTDDQIRPYNFNAAPFLADKSSAQQGLLTSEPYTIEKEGGFKPVVILLADHGYQDYNNLVMATSKLTRERPEIVQAFIEASIEGWNSYLFGDPGPGNALILKQNREMTPELIASAIALTKQYGLADSGDAAKLGIGAMSDAKWQAIFDGAVAAGLYPATLDWHKAFTTAFVNQGHGLAVKK